MKRREGNQTEGVATGAMATTKAPALAGGALRWKRGPRSGLFSAVNCDGEALVAAESPGLLDGVCRWWHESPEQAARLGPVTPAVTLGPLRCELSHELCRSGSIHGEDLLVATLTVRNDSSRPQFAEVGFSTSVEPSTTAAGREAHLPLSASGLFEDERFAALGVEQFRKDCRQALGREPMRCHYLEPAASDPDERLTMAPLLAPVVDVSAPGCAWHVAFFTPSDQPMKFLSTLSPEGNRTWQIGRVVEIAAGESVRQRCWLLIHRGDAATAWQAFHRFAHREEHRPIDWVHEFKVHYFDFLSSADGEEGKRGDGYEAAVPHFREFRVGLATQHGYYPALGDYLHPDRKTWRAMRGDKQGGAEMSFDKMKERLRATRAAGSRAAIYLHPVLFDDAAPFFEEMKDSVLIDAEGRMTPYPWQGPDTVGRNWRASLGSPEWRQHLLRQADWIMDILRPDAICVDETFAGIGYDHHPAHAGPMSAAAIGWHRDLRDLARSYGEDKAVFASDCSMSPFVLWADGEVGDHAYPGLLGSELYRQEPVRYLAALGEKPWRPCAWHFRDMWDDQMALARQVGSGVGVSNGWLEYTGLHGLPDAERRRLTADIETLF